MRVERLLDYLGPKNTLVRMPSSRTARHADLYEWNSQILALILQSITGFIMSGLYETLTKHIGAFAVIYGVFLSFGMMGPGNCSIILAAKSGPTAVRGRFYGLAAAAGKAGALIGTWGASLR